ncbi:protein kintoun [Sardina pilchardus]|uniref:protein kintoun n=1 Tax=Sardina pilchardus TaxID=27697 RepID=UPI002E11B9DB
MELGSKLKEMDLTSDEISRLGKALKNETFRKMLHEYAEEISNPENKKKYEEEIQLLEKERGMDVQFVHPKPFRVLKTSDGKQKCFINICSNELIKIAECQAVVDEDGRRGLNWSLPYSLTPGRLDVDSNGNKHMIYDVVFHPDTLHMASKNDRFMDLVDSTAMDGIQNSFKVKLDRKNTKVLKKKYKGAPHAAVIRQPTPGRQRTEKVVDKNDPLAFPYPYDKIQTLSTLNNDTMSLSGGQSTDTEPAKTIQTCCSEEQPTEPEEDPTEPHYTIKYRSVVDLQDYRCSRDSAPSPRPREIEITIHLPLLKSAADADLEVTEKEFFFKSSKPAYRLELNLSYPVDEKKGLARFNKQKKQLVVTLPVLPLKESPLSSESLELLTEGEQQNGPITEEPEEITSTGDSPQADKHTCVETDTEQSGLDVQCGESILDGAPLSDCGGLPTLRLIKQKWHISSSDVKGDTPQSVDLTSAESFTDYTEEESVHEPRIREVEVDAFIDAAVSSLIDETLEEISASLPAQGETQDTRKSTLADKEQEDSQVNTSVISQQRSNIDNSVTPHHHVNDSPSQGKDEGTHKDMSEPPCFVSDIRSDGDKHETVTRAQAKKAVRFSERVSVAGECDEDDLPEEQSFTGTKHNKQPVVVLREMNPEDGTEVIISDHTTSSAFVFQNSLLYELD